MFGEPRMVWRLEEGWLEMEGVVLWMLMADVI